MAKSGTPTPLNALDVRIQVTTDLGITVRQLASGGTGAHPNAEIARAMICRIVMDRSGYSSTDAARMVGYRSKRSVEALMAKLDSGFFDRHSAVSGAGVANATLLKGQLELATENA